MKVLIKNIKLFLVIICYVKICAKNDLCTRPEWPKPRHSVPGRGICQSVWDEAEALMGYKTASRLRHIADKQTPLHTLEPKHEFAIQLHWENPIVTLLKPIGNINSDFLLTIIFFMSVIHIFSGPVWPWPLTFLSRNGAGFWHCWLGERKAV